MATRQATVPATIERFNFTERGVHWTHSISFFLLLLTGAFLYFPSLSAVAGGIGVAHLTVLNLHVLCGAFYIGGPLLWWVLGDRRSLNKDLRALDVWDDDDVAFLQNPLSVVKEGAAPPQGRFNAGQKLNTILLFAAAVGFGVTGLLMWQNRNLPGWAQPFVQGSVNIHGLLTLIATALVLGHIYLAALHPTTRPGLSGIFSGRVSRTWARRHHPKWVAEQEALEEAQRDVRFPQGAKKP